MSFIHPLKPLRPHQVLALDMLKSSFLAGSRRPMLQLPTGAGKTVIATHIVAGARAKAKRVAFLVPALSLIDQTFERFVEGGIDPGEMGIIQANHPWRRPAAPIQIATAQTLTRRDLLVVDVAVVDEAHVKHAVIARWMAEAPQTMFIGLSATPWARGLGLQFDALVKPTSMGELIEQGYLSRFQVFAPSAPDLHGVKIVGGDYAEDELEPRMMDTVLVADVVATWKLRAYGLPTLCFAVGKRHAKQLADQFTAAGVATAYIDADTPREEREQIGRQLASGAVKVVVNIGTLTTGIDWDVRALILARPTKSRMLFVQIIGRALRPAPGKDHAIILDHSNTHQMLGMVTDIDRDRLDDGSSSPAERKRDEQEQERKTPKPVCCKSCSALLPAATAACLACGAEMPVPVRVTVKDGELTQFVGKVKRDKAVGPKAILQEMGKPFVYGQLVTLAAKRGKSQGWIAHKYRAVFDVWPKGMEDAPVVEPLPELVSYVRHLDIAFAKSKGARDAA